MKFRKCRDCEELFRTTLKKAKYCNKCKLKRKKESLDKIRNRPKILSIPYFCRPSYERDIRRKIEKIRKRMKYYYNNQDVKRVNKAPYLDAYTMFQTLESEMFRLYIELNCKYKVKNNFCKITKDDIIYFKNR